MSHPRSGPDLRAATLQRRVLVVAITASAMAILDGSVVNLALPAIDRELGGGLVVQQWVVDAYLLTLGALILVAGAIADRYGRERVMLWGVLGFAATSLLCGLAWSPEVLIVGRALQGVAGALMTPSSLALIMATFRGAERARAIGQWTAWTGAAALTAPFIGGALVDLGSWRLVFLVNLLPALLLWPPLRRLLAEAGPPPGEAKVDAIGAALAVVGLGGIVLALIEQGSLGWGSPLVLLSLLIGTACAGLFLARQRSGPVLLPLGLFRHRNFAAGNAATFAAYGGMGLGMFLLSLYLQQRVGLSAFTAGLGLLPATVPMLLLSSRVSATAGRIGPRPFMTAGPALGAAGFLWLALAPAPLDYWTDVLGPLVLFGFGLSLMVAPLTAAVLADVPAENAGVGSAVNNAVARIASLVCVAAAGSVLGGVLDDDGFSRGMLVTAALLAAGALVSAIWIRKEP